MKKGLTIFSVLVNGFNTDDTTADLVLVIARRRGSKGIANKSDLCNVMG